MQWKLTRVYILFFYLYNFLNEVYIIYNSLVLNNDIALESILPISVSPCYILINFFHKISNCTLQILNDYN